MAEFIGRDMQGARFEDVDLRGAFFRNVDLRGAKIRGAWLVDADISGEVTNLRVNGVDVAPLVEAELNRRSPDRAKLRATTAHGFREAWEVAERAWQPTVERARRLPPEMLHERVDDEWSFIETLRHLVFVVDAWVKRALLNDPAPYHPLDLPHTEMEDGTGVPNNPDARPGLDEMLALRADRSAVVRSVLAELTDARLTGQTDPLPAPGYPAADTYLVKRCLNALVLEEWEHRVIAERDLAVLEARASA
ncbi:MAG TPA: DinB family protein [Dermatophilaceae bacterium]|nr:DinB family protein [Dermatophilaceae bacterium]